RLHQSVHREGLLLCVSREQGIPTGDGDDPVPLQRIAADCPKRCSQVLTSLAKEFLRDGFWLEQCAYTQEILYCPVTQSGRQKRQGERSRDRFRMLWRLPSSLLEQGSTPGAKEFQVGRQIALCFFDVC